MDIKIKHVHLYMAKKVIKKSKRLEFTEKVITNVAKKAKKNGMVFKTYAEQLIETDSKTK